MKKVFIDTEFTDLDMRNTKLISIGMIDEDNKKPFYAETLSYNWDDCSSFVKLHVLPKLEAPLHQKVTKIGLQYQLYDYFHSFGEQVRLCSDTYNWDWIHICDLFPRFIDDECWPPNLDGGYDVMSYWGDDKEKVDEFYNAVYSPVESEIRRKYSLIEPLKLHHALDDAIANRLCWLHLGRRITSSKNEIDMFSMLTHKPNETKKDS